MAQSSKSPAKTPDLERMAEGVRRFLEGLGVDMGHPELADTPARVAAAWADELADGYQQDPQDALGALIPATSQEPVFVTGLRFVSICPHHLMTFEGVAHLVYLPNTHIAGLGRFSKLVDTFAHRLELQEELSRQISDALMTHLRARGAGCVLVGRHGCMAHRGPRQDQAKVITCSWDGALKDRIDLQQALLSAATAP